MYVCMYVCICLCRTTEGYRCSVTNVTKLSNVRGMMNLIQLHWFLPFQIYMNTKLMRLYEITSLN